MIKKTLYFGNPAYLSLCNNQLVIKLPELENSNLSDEFKQQAHITRPIEDIGVVVLDNQQITITSGAIEALLQNNCALITCDSKSMPTGLMLSLYGNTTQNERFRDQLDVSVPLKKQLWQKTVKAMIENQASVLKEFTNTEVRCMQVWANDVKSGDPNNVEAHAAAYYRSEEHTSELQSPDHVVCRLLLEKKKTISRSARLPHSFHSSPNSSIPRTPP